MDGNKIQCAPGVVSNLVWLLGKTCLSPIPLLQPGIVSQAQVCRLLTHLFLGD